MIILNRHIPSHIEIWISWIPSQQIFYFNASPIPCSINRILCITQKEFFMKSFSKAVLIMLVGSLLLLITLFMPFASAKDDQKEYLQEYPDEMFSVEYDMTNEEAINIWLFDFGKLYSQTGDSTDIIYVLFIAAFAAFAILTLLFSLLRKPIATIIFTLLSFGIFRIIIWDFTEKGVIASDYYDLGIAQYFCYLGAVIVLVGAIYLWRMKRKLRKESTAANAT